MFRILMAELTRGDVLFSAIVATVAAVVFFGIWFWQWKTKGLLINPKEDPKCLLAWFVAIVSTGSCIYLALHFWLML